MAISIAKIPDGIFKKYSNKNTEMLEEAILNGILLPDDATNGDVIKALFPDIKVYRCNGCAHPSDKTSVLLEHMLSSDWWNAPYKRG